MNSSDKPFILYRSGFAGVRLVPRGAAGWRIMILWILMVVPMSGLFIAFAMREPTGAVLYTGLALFMLGMTVWGVGGMVWMRRRAEVVDLDELLAIKRARDRQRGRK